MQEAKVTKDGLELETCGRCGGCGKHSYCQMYGNTCFGCGGTGVKLTKRGKAARAYLETLRSKRADQILVGGEIKHDGVPGFSKGSWGKVEKITVGPSTSKYMEAGEWKTPEGDHYTFTTAACIHSGVKFDRIMRVRQTKESLAATAKLAQEFQATLTKQGTPRKANR